MAKATVGTALHYLSQHTELDARTEGLPGRGGERKTNRSHAPHDGQKPGFWTVPVMVKVALI